MSGAERLYGSPGAEVLYDDPATVYETDYAEWDDDQGEPRPEKLEIEEWTVHPPRYHLPTTAAVLEWIEEWTADCGDVSEGFDVSFRSPVVTQAAGQLLDAIAAGIGWRMADRHVASHWVTWDENGQPLLDGKPMYVRAAS